MAVIATASAVQAGLVLGTASILSVGPNNLMLVREGLSRGRMATVATIVWTSYVALLAAAYCLADSICVAESDARAPLTWLGFLAISWFATQSFRAALRSKQVGDWAIEARESTRSCLLRVMAVVWLNPLTYLELFLIPAALCGTFAATGSRLQFLATLIFMAAVACYGYAFGGEFVGSLLRRHKTLRVFDILSGILLATMAAVIAVRLVSDGQWPWPFP